jgi:hypothetical protein
MAYRYLAGFQFSSSDERFMTNPPRLTGHSLPVVINEAGQEPDRPQNGTGTTPRGRGPNPVLAGLSSMGKTLRKGAKLGGRRIETNNPLHSASSFGIPFNGFDQHVSVTPATPEAVAAQTAAALAETPVPMTTPAAPSARTRKAGAELFAKFNHANPGEPPSDVKPAELKAFDDREAYTMELMRSFPSGPLGLHSTLHDLEQSDPANQDRRYERPTLLAQTLSAVTRGDTKKAAAVVDYLRDTGLDFRAQPGNRRAGNANEARAGAWRSAQMLSTTPAGQSILRELVRGGLPQQDEDLALLNLQASHQIALAHPGTDTSPEGIDALIGKDGPARGTIAGRAAGATAKLLRDGDAHRLTDGDYGAMLAAQQHLYDSGDGTELAQAQHRLHKFITKTVPRASESKSSRMLHLPQRVANQHKNPLLGLRNGVQGANYATIAKNAAKIDSKSRASLTQLDTYLSARDPHQLLDQPDAVDALLSHATAKHWLGQSMEHAQKPLDDTGRQSVANHALAQYEKLHDARNQPGAPALSEPQQQQFARLQMLFERPDGRRRSTAELSNTGALAAHARTGFGPDTFGQLAASAGWAKDANGASPAGNVAAKAFWSNADAASKVMQMSDLKPRDMQPEGVRDALKDLVSNIESGSKLTLSDGSRIAASTRGLSSNVGKLISATTVVSPRLDLRYGFRREAVVTVSRSTHGGEIFLGTQKQHAGQAGVGIQVGHDFDVVRAAVTVDATLLAQESTQPSGICLRIARRANTQGTNYDDARLKQGMNSLVDYVFDSAEHPPENPEAAWNELGRKMFRNQDLSVTWTNQKSTKSSSAVTANASVAAKVGTEENVGRFGAQAGIGYERTHKTTADSVDQSGRMQIESHRIGNGSRWIGNFSVPTGFSHTVDHGHVSVGGLSGNLPQNAVDLKNTGFMAKARLIRENGEYQHRVCYADTDFSSAKEYVQAINANKGIWIDMFSRQKAKNPANQAAEDAMDPHRRGMMKLDEHLREVETNARPNQSFFHRFRLREQAAQKLNLCNTAEAGMRARGASDADLQKLETWRSTLLNHPDSWLPVELKAYERNSNASMTGPQVGLHLTTRTGTESERELIAETLGYQDLDKLDRDTTKALAQT